MARTISAAPEKMYTTQLDYVGHLLQARQVYIIPTQYKVLVTQIMPTHEAYTIRDLHTSSTYNYSTWYVTPAMAIIG